MFCHHILLPFKLILRYRSFQRSGGDDTFGGVRLSILSHLNRFSTGAEWSILVLGLPSTAKDPVKHKSATLLRGIQNGWAFKKVVVSTCCAIAVDYAFNVKGCSVDNRFWLSTGAEWLTRLFLTATYKYTCICATSLEICAVLFTTLV